MEYNPHEMTPDAELRLTSELAPGDRFWLGDVEVVAIGRNADGDLQFAPTDCTDFIAVGPTDEVRLA